MVPLSALDKTQYAHGELYQSGFVAISHTDFPALSTIVWDYDATPALSSLRIQPRWAQLVYVVNQ